MSKQTAVEYLIFLLQKNGFIGTYCEKDEIESRQKLFDMFIEEAKEIEKKQIINSYLKDRGKRDFVGANKLWTKAEMYFENTYSK